MPLSRDVMLLDAVKSSGLMVSVELLLLLQASINVTTRLNKTTTFMILVFNICNIVILFDLEREIKCKISK